MTTDRRGHAALTGAVPDARAAAATAPGGAALDGPGDGSPDEQGIRTPARRRAAADGPGSAATPKGGGGTAAIGAAGAAVTVASILTNGLAYLVPVLGARQLSPADLGALATVLALAAIAAVPGFGLQIAVAVHRARHGPTATTRLAVLTAAVTAGVTLAAAPLLTAVLRLPIALTLLLAATTFATVLSGRWLGELQGDQRFLRLSAAMTVLAAGRYGGLIVGLALGRGAVACLLLGTATGFLALPVLARLATPRPFAAARPRATSGPVATLATPAALVPAVPEPAAPTPATTPPSLELPPLTPPAGAPPAGAVAPTAPADLTSAAPPTPHDRALRPGQVLTACTATLAMLTISYADLILARQLLSADGSGGYAVGSVLTKGALWAPQVVTLLVLPRLARGDRRARALGLAVIAACGAVLVAASAVAGELAFRLAGGADYLHLAGEAPLFAATGALYAIVFMLVNDRVATGARWPAVPLWAAIAGLAGAALLIAPRTVAGVLTCALATAGVTLAVLAWLVFRPVSPRRPARS